jgi:hypothetical protein
MAETGREDEAAIRYCHERRQAVCAGWSMERWKDGKAGTELLTFTVKSGHVQTIALLREDREALQRRVEELEDVIKLLNRKAYRITRSHS